jgi:hypothetical protein
MLCGYWSYTEHMIPDYKAFTSYQSCKNEFATLGDTTQLPIMGRGKARFMLNGKVIEVRNALHVPDLRAPLRTPFVDTGTWTVAVTTPNLE